MASDRIGPESIQYVNCRRITFERLDQLVATYNKFVKQ